MLEKLFWFGLGYFTARYLILKNGVDAYKTKEASLIGAGKEKIQDIQEEYFPEPGAPGNDQYSEHPVY